MDPSGARSRCFSKVCVPWSYHRWDTPAWQHIAALDRRPGVSFGCPFLRAVVGIAPCQTQSRSDLDAREPFGFGARGGRPEFVDLLVMRRTEEASLSPAPVTGPLCDSPLTAERFAFPHVMKGYVALDGHRAIPP